MIKLALVLFLATSLTACEGPQTTFELLRAKHFENKKRFSKEIRETVKECLTSVRQNPDVQNFNDDNEIVESCTKYALNLYNAEDI